MDLLSGSYSVSGAVQMAGYFHVLWGEGNGSFKEGEALEGSDGEPLVITPSKADLNQSGGDGDIVRICTRPTAVDFDGDGDLDIVTGNFRGTYYLFRSEGAGKFSPKSEPVMAGEKQLMTGHHSDPAFADWDGDGDLDLIAGSSNGGVVMVENTAGAGKEMIFGNQTTLVEPANGRISRWSGEPATLADSTRVSVSDFNGDGKLDLIVGDRVTINQLPDGITKAESKAALEEIDQKIQKLMNQDPKDETAQDKIQNEFRKLYDSRQKFLKEQSTGCVWVYCQE